jgi:hypothetical protein
MFGRNFPIIFILLKTKAENDYLRAISKLKSLVECNFRNIISDFEVSLVNAFQKSFPDARSVGCNFLFSQSIWRSVQRFGLKKFYDT